jgi:hypothetical protein
MATTKIKFDMSENKNMIFAYSCNHFYVEMSRLVPTIFKDDLDVFFVLASITNASIAKEVTIQEKTKKFTSDNKEIFSEYSFIKLLPLSEITGLPRTTVRRKAERLIKMGYIEHIDGLGYRLRKGAMSESPEMRAIIRAQLTLVSRLLNTMLERDLIEVVDHGPQGAACRDKPALV